MLLPVPPQSRRRRVKPKLPSAGAATGLAVIGVENLVVGPSEMSCTVVFNTTEDQPLNDVVDSDPSKWNARVGGVRFIGDAIGYNDFQRIDLHFSADDEASGANELNYTNAPSDISDILGRQLGAFSGFPL